MDINFEALDIGVWFKISIEVTKLIKEPVKQGEIEHNVINGRNRNRKD